MRSPTVIAALALGLVLLPAAPPLSAVREADRREIAGAAARRHGPGAILGP